MSRQTKESLAIAAMSICMLLAVFAKPLHLPDAWRIVVMLGNAALVYFLFHLQKQIKKEKLGIPEREKFPPTILSARREKLFWTVAASMFFGCIFALITLPFTVENFTPGLYLFVIPFLLVGLPLFLLYFRKKLFAPSGPPPPSD